MRREITIVECDRCGKNIDEDPLKIASWFKAEHVYTRAKMQIWGKDGIYSNGNQEYIFCNKCADSFEEWMKKGKEE